MLQAPDLPDEKRVEYAKGITGNSRRLASLITNILKLNKLENQQIFPVPEVYDLSEQLCECILQYEDIWDGPMSIKWTDTLFVVGMIVGIIGIALVCAAYPLYNWMIKRERAKIAPEIIRLTDELMK